MILNELIVLYLIYMKTLHFSRKKKVNMFCQVMCSLLYPCSESREVVVGLFGVGPVCMWCSVINSTMVTTAVAVADREHQQQ